jgi:hypothetical protein
MLLEGDGGIKNCMEDLPKIKTNEGGGIGGSSVMLDGHAPVKIEPERAFCTCNERRLICQDGRSRQQERFERPFLN